jgi:hypothetical protein
MYRTVRGVFVLKPSTIVHNKRPQPRQVLVSTSIARLSAPFGQAGYAPRDRSRVRPIL